MDSYLRLLRDRDLSRLWILPGLIIVGVSVLISECLCYPDLENFNLDIRNEFEIVAYASNVITLDDNIDEFDDWEDVGKEFKNRPNGKARSRGSYAQALKGD
jgi:hypothetical protein